MNAVQITLLVMATVALLVGAVGADYAVARFFRNVVSVSFGFPREFQSPIAVEQRSRMVWFRLGTSRCGEIVTNKLYSAILDEGLAFEGRSIFGFLVMKTVVVPWDRLRWEIMSGRFGTSERLEVIDDLGAIANTIELGHNTQWRAIVQKKLLMPAS